MVSALLTPYIRLSLRWQLEDLASVCCQGQYNCVEPSEICQMTPGAVLSVGADVSHPRRLL